MLLTLLFMSVILATQLSFGRMFAFAFEALLAGWRQMIAGVREWRENRRRDKQRQEVIAKHAKKSGVKPEELEAERSGAQGQGATRDQPRAPRAGAGQGGRRRPGSGSGRAS